jgi:hypothetical protein
MPQMQQQSSMAMAPSATFDLSNIDYTLPMQLLDGQQDFQQGTLQVIRKSSLAVSHVSSMS